MSKIYERIDNSDKEMYCLICTLDKEYACTDCCKDWENEGKEKEQ